MNNLKKLRLEKGLTQKELSQVIGIKQNTLSYWERGIYDIDNAALAQLAQIFECTTDHILGVEYQKIDLKKRKELSSSINLTEHEQKVISAYRLQPEIQPAVNRLLGIEENTFTTYKAARSPDNHEGIVQIEKSRWDEMEKTPKTDDDLL